MAKLFEVLVENVSTDRMFIVAQDEQNAREIAQELVDAGRGRVESGYDMGTAKVVDAGECTNADEGEKAAAESNRVEYLELIEEGK